jgi:hypothetical protein
MQIQCNIHVNTMYLFKYIIYTWYIDRIYMVYTLYIYLNHI